jgi:pilus assembly protein CpaF
VAQASGRDVSLRERLDGWGDGSPMASPRLGFEDPSEAPADEAPNGASTPHGEARDDPSDKLRRRVHLVVLDRLAPRLAQQALTADDLRSLVRPEIERAVDEQISLAPEERQDFIDSLTSDVMGYGPLDAYLAAPDVTEIMVVTHDSIYVERGGRLFETNARFGSEAHLRLVIDRMVGQVGRRVDESSPMVDARLADGSRVNAIVPPLAIDGPMLTIRKFAKQRFTVSDLVQIGTLTPALAQFVGACVQARLNILISGGTGTGKTTLLNALSTMLGSDERIVTIEDAAELQLQQRHVIRLECRSANVEGRGEVTVRDLVRNALRMRPDRIIVGEVRGAEALDMLQAMNTGHDGSLSTLHANSPRDALSRLETMILMSGFDLPVRAIREHVSSALDLIIQIARFRDGTRRVESVCEVERVESGTIVMSELFRFDSSQADGSQPGRGSIVPTGVRPAFSAHFGDLGINLSAELFEASAGRSNGSR